MNCRRIEEMIPLYIEGDLETDRALLVSAHLKSCAACSRLAGGFNESQEWLHSYTPPAFDSTFFDGLKSGVLARINEENARPSFFQLIAAHWRWDAALAAALLLVVLSGLTFYTYRQAVTTVPEQVAQFPSRPDAVPPLQDPPKPANDDLEQITRPPQHSHRTLREAVAKAVGPALPESVIGTLTADPGIPLTNDPGIESADFSATETSQDQVQPPVKVSASPSESMTRIDIQTSDPTIRIIWFAPNNVSKNSGRRSSDS